MSEYIKNGIVFRDYGSFSIYTVEQKGCGASEKTLRPFFFDLEVRDTVNSIIGHFSYLTKKFNPSRVLYKDLKKGGF